MHLNLITLFSLYFLSIAAYGQETNATTLLNSLLAKKPALAIQSTCSGQSYVCKLVGPMRDKIEVCSFETKNYPCQSTIPASVTSSSVLQVKQIEYGTPNNNSIPEKAYITRRIFSNCSSGTTLSSTASFSINANQSTQVNKTQGVSSTEGKSFNLNGIANGIGTPSLNLTWNTTVTTSTATTEQVATTVTRSINETVNVQPLRAVSFEAIVYESGTTIPFTAKAVIDGPLPPNISGLKNARDLLTEKERTVDLVGTITVIGASLGFIRTKDLGPKDENGCKENSISDKNETQNLYSPSESLFKTFTKVGLSKSEKESTAVKLENKEIPMVLSVAGGDTIGAPDGTHCEILSTSQAYIPTASCGFNDAGAPIQGIYTVEQLMCRTYSNGQMVSQIPKTQETWTGQCWNP